MQNSTNSKTIAIQKRSPFPFPFFIVRTDADEPQTPHSFNAGGGRLVERKVRRKRRTVKVVRVLPECLYLCAIPTLFSIFISFFFSPHSILSFRHKQANAPPKILAFTQGSYWLFNFATTSVTKEKAEKKKKKKDSSKEKNTNNRAYDG